jgi:hypothetical protein
MRRRNRTKLDRELAEVAAMVRAHTRWHHERCAEAIAGPHGALVEQLVDILGKLELRDGEHLVDFINSRSWQGVDADTRFICLHAIDGAVIKLREQAGLAPFDDPLEGQPDNVFLTVKQILAVGEGAAGLPLSPGNVTNPMR